MGGRAVQVEVAFLDVFAVIALIAGEAEEALFQEGVFAVPEGEGETDLLMAVADAGNAVFVPAIGARAGGVVRDGLPGRAIRAVILAHGSPGSFAEVRAPALPVRRAFFGFRESAFLGCHDQVPKGSLACRAARRAAPRRAVLSFTITRTGIDCSREERRPLSVKAFMKVES